MKRMILVLMACLVFSFAGCVQEKTAGSGEEIPETGGETLDTSINEEDIPYIEETDTVDAGDIVPEETGYAVVAEIDAEEVPYMEEEDSVEIGEMI
ncbi:MAG: hypothetical protein JW724_05770 [Candidatus Altiarchaeota archaeon]|nr:hypothetical protein [Candidatus Altiarchaeota archaeon]